MGEETNIAQCYQMIMRRKLNIDLILSSTEYRIMSYNDSSLTE